MEREQSQLSRMVEEDEIMQAEQVEAAGARMANGEGFTAQDRKSLTTLEVELKHMAISMSDLLVRMGKLEESRVSQRDLEQIYTDVNEIRVRKAEKSELHGASIEDHERRLRVLEQRTWIWLGGGLAVLALIEVFFTIFRKGV